MHLTNFHKTVDFLIHHDVGDKYKLMDRPAVFASRKRLMNLLGDPQNAHPSIHVAGTSGKGTICYIVDALLRAHSQRTGMIQSPHVYDIRERIQINGQLISEKRFVSTFNRVMTAFENGNEYARYAEILTAMGFEIFAKNKLDYTIVETNLGGAYDITNTITRANKLCVVGQIGLDHTEILGSTIVEIATEKAGIISKHNHVIALQQSPEVNNVFEKRCQEVGATIEWVQGSEDYQQANDSMALAICRFLAKRDDWSFDESVAHGVLQQVFIPGRFEKRRYRDHLTILDVAHNPQKLTAAANRLKLEEKTPVTTILALGSKKDVRACVASLLPVTNHIIVTEYFKKDKNIPPRAIPADEIIKVCNELNILAEVAPTVRGALDRASELPAPILVTGSFYLVGEADSLF